MASHDSRFSRTRNIHERRIIVKGSSVTRMGCTRARAPKFRADACSRKPPMRAAMPPSQAGCRIRYPISASLNVSFGGAVRAARRCSTDARALHAAVRTARNAAIIGARLSGPRMGCRPSAEVIERLTFSAISW